MNITDGYSLDRAFEIRKKVGRNILNIIKEKGYTKSSFSRLSNISRTTLDRIINGEIDNKAIFTTHINKILDNQILTVKELLYYNSEQEVINRTDSAFSDNSPQNYELKPEAKNVFMILDDILHLCELYYD
jgi:transcriptional regulator with XRE-family HTH domain